MTGPREHSALRWALTPPAALYKGLIGLRNRYYDRPSAQQQSELPVISVGNVTVGGTGKTPLVAWIARHLSARGFRPAIVSRGYGGTSGRGPRVVSRGDGPRCGWRACGDEPYLLAATLPEAIIIVGSDRVAGAAQACKEGADVVILDDGFQHRRLARELDLVLLDASDPFGGLRMLPAGLLREPVAGLSRADLVIVTRSGRDERHPEIERIVREYNPTVPILRAGHRVLGFVDPNGATVAPPDRAVAFCGIGNPKRFRLDVEAQGTNVVRFEASPDHHPYRTEELQKLSRHARDEQAVLVTTEKDLARFEDTTLRSIEAPLLALRIEAEIYDAAPLIQRLAEALSRGVK